jgi:hypothetical protein
MAVAAAAAVGAAATTNKEQLSLLPGTNPNKLVVDINTE